MARVNDVCAVKDTKSLLKKPLGLGVKENERSVFSHRLLAVNSKQNSDQHTKHQRLSVPLYGGPSVFFMRL